MFFRYSEKNLYTMRKNIFTGFKHIYFSLCSGFAWIGILTHFLLPEIFCLLKLKKLSEPFRIWTARKAPDKCKEMKIRDWARKNAWAFPATAESNALARRIDSMFKIKSFQKVPKQMGRRHKGILQNVTRITRVLAPVNNTLQHGHNFDLGIRYSGNRELLSLKLFD